MTVLRVLLLTACLTAFSASAASAEIRTLAIDDPQDAVPTVSGTPNSPDISRLEARYDSAGSLTITVHYYNDAATIDRSQNYAFWGTFSIGGIDTVGTQTGCAAIPGSIYGQHHVYATSTSFYDRASVSGYDGTLDFTRTTSPDNRTVTLTASPASIANRDYRCMNYQLNARRYSTPENIYSNYDAGCDCWYTSGVIDVVGQRGQYDTIGAAFFNGYQPPPPPACSNGIDDDGDGLIDYRGTTTVTARLTPVRNLHHLHPSPPAQMVRTTTVTVSSISRILVAAGRRRGHQKRIRPRGAHTSRSRRVRTVA